MTPHLSPNRAGEPASRAILVRDALRPAQLTTICDVERASRSLARFPKLEKSANGSVDIFFGPEAPEGKDINWVPTDPKRWV